MNRDQSTLPLVFDVIPQQWAAVVDAFEKLVPGDGYCHWEDLLDQPEPAGISREAWWVALKLSRSAGKKSIGLRDTTGRAFEINLKAFQTGILHAIDRSDRDVGFDRQLEERFAASALVAEVIASAQLAGAKVARGRAKEMLRAGQVPSDPDERMVWDLHLALEEVRRRRDQPLNPAMILDLHRLVTSGTAGPTGSEGRLRQADESATIMDQEGRELHRAPPSSEMEERLESLCAFGNDDSSARFIHPIVRAGILHFWLAYDRPFSDGNGRLARALFLHALLHRGYEVSAFLAPSSILLAVPQRYAAAFSHTETDDNDLTYFILHQLDVIGAAHRAFLDRVKCKTGEIEPACRRRPGLRDLNPRQQAVMAYAFLHPDASYGIARHQHSHGVTHQTARDDLFDLVDRGWLEVKRERRVYVFRMPAGAEKVIQPAAPRRRFEEEETGAGDQLPTSLL
jgi:Fic family protein